LDRSITKADATIPMTEILEKLEAIESQLRASKEILNSDEAAAFLSIEKSYLFKLTSGGILPYSKPNGKKIYFAKNDLVAWAMQNRNSGTEEKAIKAATYLAINKGI
jgi:hypothetical protein